MHEIVRLEELRKLFQEQIGNELDAYQKAEKQFVEVENAIIALDDKLLADINKAIKASTPNEQTINKIANRIKVLKFKESNVNKKTGKCEPRPRAYLIDRGATNGACFYWSLAKKSEPFLSEVGPLTDAVFDEYYTLSSKLNGEGRKDSKALKNQLKHAENSINEAFKAFKKDNNIKYWSLNKFQNEIARLESRKQWWQVQIENAKNAKFEPYSSQSFKFQVMEPYLLFLKGYYLSMAKKIQDDYLIEKIVLKDYKFEVKKGHFLFIFADFQTPLIKHNVGFFTLIDTSQKAHMADQYKSNTLAFGFNESNSDLDYIVITMMKLMQ